MSEIDYVYYNFLIHNDTTQNQEAKFSETRLDSIISNAEDWEMAVARFSIPGCTIPLFYYQPNKYYIGIQLADGDKIFVTQVLIDNPTPVSTGLGWSQSNSSDPIISQQIFDFQLWIDCINMAILRLQNTSGIPLENIPVAYFQDINTIGIYVPQNQSWWPNQWSLGVENPAITTFPKLYLSRELFLQFFSGLEFYRIDENHAGTSPDATVDVATEFHLDYIIKFVDRPTTNYPRNTRFPSIDTALIDAKNQYQCTFAWTKIRRIILATSSIQINGEQIGASKDGKPYFQQMLTDFELPVESHPLNRQTIYYQPDKYRYASIVSNGEIRRMDIRLYYQTYDTLELYPIILPPNFDINIKIQFRRIRQVTSLLKRMIDVFKGSEKDLDIEAQKDKSNNLSMGYSLVAPKTNTTPNELNKRDIFIPQTHNKLYSLKKNMNCDFPPRQNNSFELEDNRNTYIPKKQRGGFISGLKQ